VGEVGVGRLRGWDVILTVACIPTFIPTTAGNPVSPVGYVGAKPQVSGLRGRSGHPIQITQIYEGTNQIQRVVIARSLLR
jgi:hypothetical protein